jgi:TRAP-type mannitol/chloroaromatic compound transport system permease small subunit
MNPQPRGWQALDRCIIGLLAAVRWLVLPIGLLLFLQWPLRDLLHRWSVQANDLAQWLFALYVACALTQATRHHAHLAIDGFARRLAPEVRDRIGRVGGAVCVFPWAMFVLITGFPSAWQSLRQFEAFPETSNQGYFVVKLSVMLLAMLLIVQVLLDLSRPREK